MGNIDATDGKSQDETGNNIPDRVYDRLKAAGGFRFDTQLATDMGADRTSVGKWRQRGTLPMDILLRYAREKGYSLDWLFFGTEEADAGGGYAVNESPAVYQDLDFDLFKHVAALVRAILDAEKCIFSDEKIDYLIGYVYNDAMKAGGKVDEDKVYELIKMVAN